MNDGPRQVARGLVFDGAGRLLMVQWRDPVTGHGFVEPPGGRREEGETFEDALRREIAEETGLEDVEVGELVAEIDHRFTFAGQDYANWERYFVCRLTGSRTSPVSYDPVEHAGIVGTEWMSAGDLEARAPGGVEPPQLREILRRLGRTGAQDS